MNEYERLKQAFDNFIVSSEPVPVGYIKYKGRSRRYVTYTFTSDTPRLFGDNKEIGSVVSVDVDIYSDRNFLDIEDQVEVVMESNDYIRVGSSPDMYEEETGLYHKTLEFEKERFR